MNAFEWTREKATNPECWTCTWNRVNLCAWADGHWFVDGHGIVPVSHAQQTPGKDLHEAKQRAQAAALVASGQREQRAKARQHGAVYKS